MEITITRALSKLKTLKSEYSKAVAEVKAIAVKRGAVLCGVNSPYKENDFIDMVKTKNQSIQNMMRLMIEIKSKIDLSNITTKVMIGSTEMTVQEAIVAKTLLPYKKNYLSSLKREYSKSMADYEGALETNRRRVEKIVQDQCAGNTNGSIKADVEKNAYESTENLYKVDYVDPLKVSELIENLEKEIVEFETNVDFALSESNSTTHIDINC